MKPLLAALLLLASAMWPETVRRTEITYDIDGRTVTVELVAAGTAPEQTITSLVLTDGAKTTTVPSTAFSDLKRANPADVLVLSGDPGPLGIGDIASSTEILVVTINSMNQHRMPALSLLFDDGQLAYTLFELQNPNKKEFRCTVYDPKYEVLCERGLYRECSAP